MALPKYVTADELRHGDIVNVTIHHSSGDKRLQAVVVVEKEYVYFCQDEFCGSTPNGADRFGYRYTWCCRRNGTSVDSSDIELLARAGHDVSTRPDLSKSPWFVCDKGLDEGSILSKDIDIKKIMTSIKTFVKNLTLSADEKLLRKLGLKNDCGEYTSECSQPVSSSYCS